MAGPDRPDFVSSSLTQRDRGLAESGFTFRGGHLVERHGLLLLVAFGESIVAIGIGLAAVELEARMYVAAVLGLLLVSALWWTYFARDDERALEVLQAAPAREQLGMAIGAFFYAFVVMLLGVVILAAGLALTIAAVDIRTSVETAVLLGGGAALYVAGDVLFRLKLGIEPLRYRVAAIPLLRRNGSPRIRRVRHGPAARDDRACSWPCSVLEKRARPGTFTAPG